MSKKIIFFIFLLFSNAVYAKNNFVPGVSDLPVPINFFLIDNSSSVFYDDANRFVQASFKGRGNKSDVEEFYQKTLPALGWKKSGDDKYSRDEEILTLDIVTISKEKKYDNLQINFKLIPED